MTGHETAARAPADCAVRPGRRATGAAAGIVAVALLGVTGCGEKKEAPAPPEKVTKVAVLRLEPERIEEWIDLPGSIEPFRAVTVSPEIGGRLEVRTVNEGDVVAAGQRLAVVDREHAEIVVHQSELGLQQAKLGAARARTGLEQAGIAVVAARSGVAQSEAAAVQAVEQEKKFRAVRDKAGADLERARTLFEEKLAPRSFLEIQETAFAAAAADVATAVAAVEVAAAGKVAATNGLEAALAGEKAAADEVASAASRIESAAAGLDAAQLFLRRTELLSPLAGQVLKVFADPGEVVEANKPLITIIDAARVKAVFPLPERDAPYVRRGSSAAVTVPTLGTDVRNAVVSLVAVAADSATSTYRVEVELPNPGGALKPGMLAKLRLLRRASDEAVAVPLFAVMRSAGRAHAFVAEGGVARRREVVTGILDAGRVEVLSGLALGDLLIVKGQRDLEDGRKVELP